jgi:hypothetical protein
MERPGEALSLLPSEERVTGRALKIFVGISAEVIPTGCRELPDSLRKAVLVDMAEDRITRVKPKASFVVLFQRVPGFQE